MDIGESAPGAGRRQPVTGAARTFVIAADRLILGLARHWLPVMTAAVFIYVGLPFLAPVFMKLGWTGAAQVIYSAYSGLCHQLGYRSWYLFGEHWAYPRDIFQAFSGIDPNDLFAARAFTGNAQMGFKVAYCERDVAIYGAIGVAGLIYGLPFVRRRVKPLPWLAYALIGVFPIAFDGFSQLFSQYPYNTLGLFGWLPYRESNALLRTFTGSLFGLANAWLALPYLNESFNSIKEDLATKLARVDAEGPPR